MANIRHERTIIKTLLKALLLQFVDVGSKIFVARPHPIFSGNLPCLLIYSSEETLNNIDYVGVRNGNGSVQSEFVIDILHKSPTSHVDAESIEAFVDSREKEVLNAIVSDLAIGVGYDATYNWILSIVATSSSAVNQQWDADQVVYGRRLTVRVVYKPVQPEIAGFGYLKSVRIDCDGVQKYSDELTIDNE